MTFLEWETYQRAMLENSCEIVESVLEEPFLSVLLLDEQREAIRNIVTIAQHVADTGHIDEDTGKWKISD
tara:strand:+ start:362 stop:571 length:210 start_codon:yes stop_codon:yes gene_type:complete